jgi:hypothetical protein
MTRSSPRALSRPHPDPTADGGGTERFRKRLDKHAKRRRSNIWRRRWIALKRPNRRVAYALEERETAAHTPYQDGPTR